MVTVSQSKISKSEDKIPASKILSHKNNSETLDRPVSPNSASEDGREEELQALRARNKVLTEALEAVKVVATEEKKKMYDLVWFAKNRYRHPTHQDSHRIEKSEEHREELDKLRSTDADFHHGFHCGVLAASRMFEEHADILHINDHNEINEKFMSDASNHTKKIQESVSKYPHVDAHETPSSLTSA